MEPILFHEGATIKDPEERVVQAGLFLLKSWRRVPTQDEVTQSLRLPDQSSAKGFRSTAKGTVTKYWPAFQAAIASALEHTQPLPNELENAILEVLHKLINLGRKGEDPQFSDKQFTASKHQTISIESEKECLLLVQELTKQLAELQEAHKKLNIQLSRQSVIIDQLNDRFNFKQNED